jgi:hypothetical protein
MLEILNMHLGLQPHVLLAVIWPQASTHMTSIIPTNQISHWYSHGTTPKGDHECQAEPPPPRRLILSDFSAFPLLHVCLPPPPSGSFVRAIMAFAIFAISPCTPFGVQQVGWRPCHFLLSFAHSTNQILNWTTTKPLASPQILGRPQIVRCCAGRFLQMPDARRQTRCLKTKGSKFAFSKSRVF